MAFERYAYAVSTIRTRENALFTPEFLEQLITAPSYEALRRLLADRGWLPMPSNGNDDPYLNRQLAETWELIHEVAPDPSLLEALVLKHDFHNLKTAIKCSFNQTSPQEYFLAPSIYDAGEITRLVDERAFEQLPACMREAAQKAYDVFLRTQDGQYADVYVDTAALTAIREAGRRSGNALMDSLTELMCASANIKVAVRAERTKKPLSFLQDALCPCDTLNREELALAAVKGEEPLLAYLMSTAYADTVKSLKESQSAFEKSFDDLIMEKIEPVRYVFFGPEPLIAYYLAREAEIKNVRILLSGKQHGASETTLRERMRRLYV